MKKNLKITSHRVAVSKEETEAYKALVAQQPSINRKIIYSFFPADKHNCPCQKTIQDLKQRFSVMTPSEVGDTKLKMEYIRCPRDKSDMQKYEIYCNSCEALMGDLYATDNTLVDYCDFHYISYFTIETRQIVEEVREEIMDKQGYSLSKFKVNKLKRVLEEAFWQGAFGVNLSPIDGKIGLECACGNDTRDFRNASNLPKLLRDQKVENSMKGRDFGQEDSKYKVVPV